FVVIVCLITGTESQFFSLFNPIDTPRQTLFVINTILLAFSLLVAAVRLAIGLFGQKWIARLSSEKGGKKFLLTWQTLVKNRINIIRYTWGVFQLIWVGLILAIGIPLLTEWLLGSNAKNPPLVGIIHWVLDPSLSHRLVLSALLVFILLSFI